MKLPEMHARGSYTAVRLFLCLHGINVAAISACHRSSGDRRGAKGINSEQHLPTARGRRPSATNGSKRVVAGPTQCTYCSIGRRVSVTEAVSVYYKSRAFYN
ncbi:hypothetical protein BaRGS_00007201 [Batillaria attramentaria]|uniref:Secreted protein n=1 Tax=Batillaria attramentaria TaxID=370345 RepID=A0ABD0LQC2_9CAEN